MTGFAAAQPILRAATSAVQRSTRETMPGLLDHFVGTHEKRFRDRESERLRGGEVDYQFEFGGLLNRDVGRLGAAQNLIYELGGAPVQVR
jgi:hypothetical protein